VVSAVNRIDREETATDAVPVGHHILEFSNSPRHLSAPPPTEVFSSMRWFFAHSSNKTPIPSSFDQVYDIYTKCTCLGATGPVIEQRLEKVNAGRKDAMEPPVD
jgi:hypothetical protein